MIDSGIQHKPAFKDNEREPVYRPPNVPPSLSLVCDLIDAGVQIGDTQRAAEIIEQAFDDVGDSRAGDFLAVVLSRLEGQGRRGKELRAALLSAVGVDGAESLSEQAKTEGVSKQTWHKSIARLKKRLTTNA